MSHGLDQVFPEPPHEIRGATPVDQAWADEVIEAGSTCCGWVIKPRPADLDPKPLPVAVSPLVKAPAKPVKPKKKIALWMLMMRHPVIKH